MPTTYTTNLKLAKPATGDLSGTWGATVNDNVTSMIEEAITGRAALSTWTSNAQTITTSNGTTSSGRCLLLDLAGTLTATGTLTVPSVNKFYIVRNGTTGGYAVTVTMGSGTTVSVPNGETVMVYVDGTNIKVAVTTVSKADTATTATTVTTNANLTGHITSTGNAAVLGSFTLAQLNTAISDANVATGGGTATGTNTGDQTNISGNAATVTTNANLTGPVTSTGNATAIADSALSIAKTSGLQTALNAKANLASPTGTGTATWPSFTGTDTTDATSTTSAPLKTAGGLAVAKKLYVGTDANIAGQINLTGDLIKSRSEPGVESWISVANTSNTANSGAVLRAEVAGASAGDAYSSYYVAGVTAWSVGIDNSDSDKFKISSSLILGTSDALTIDPSTNLVELTGGLKISGGVSTAGGIWYGAANGLQLRGATGSAYDFGLYGASGAAILRNPTGTVDLQYSGAMLGTGTGGLGYGTGAGGTVTQASSKATAVTLNKICGRITMHNTSLPSTGIINFALNNNLIGAGDNPRVWIVNSISGPERYQTWIGAVSAGVCTINIRNVHSTSLTDAVVIGFEIGKAVTS